MPTAWTVERLKALPAAQVRSLWDNARGRDDEDARRITSLIEEHDLLRDQRGGLPFDHPIMLEIQAICAEPASVAEAVAASEQGLPALAGMEHRLIAALGNGYGSHYTTNHAGRCIADEMLARGWKTTVQRPMPAGSVAKSATVFVRKG